ncbi:MAG: hypothetical protein SFU86_15500 [Pirellulaceae bacterium]|nr:hypothetical protein [Pirellulaceae bacterium]
MARHTPGRFLAGLVVETAGVVAAVALLPKLPWDELTGSGHAIADHRPTLVERAADEPMPPADPADVERRLDAAGQRLLEGAVTYIQQHTQDLLESPAAPPAEAAYVFPAAPAAPTAGSFTPQNAFRY